MRSKIECVAPKRVFWKIWVAVRFDEDGVVQVLEACAQGAGHRQVAEDVAALQQVERRAAVPALAVAQRQRRRDGGVRLGRGVVGSDGRRDGGVRLGRRVVGREGRRDGGVPLGHRPVGQQRVGDGLGHLGRGAVGHRPSGPTCSSSREPPRWRRPAEPPFRRAPSWVIWAVVL